MPQLTGLSGLAKAMTEKINLPALTLPYPALPPLPCPTALYPTLPYPTLPHLTLPYPTLPYPTLRYPTLPHPAGEGAGDARLVYVPPMDWPAGSQRPVFDYEDYPRYVGRERRIPAYYPSAKLPNTTKNIMGHIPQVNHTHGFYEGDYAISNEHGLSFGESTTSGRTAAAPVSAGGPSLLSMYELSRLAAERTTSSRAAVLLMGEMAERYGFWGGAAPDTGAESILVADQSEQFIFHVLAESNEKGGAIWAAQKMPKDHVTIVSNGTQPLSHLPPPLARTRAYGCMRISSISTCAPLHQRLSSARLTSPKKIFSSSHLICTASHVRMAGTHPYAIRPQTLSLPPHPTHALAPPLTTRAIHTLRCARDDPPTRRPTRARHLLPPTYLLISPCSFRPAHFALLISPFLLIHCTSSFASILRWDGKGLLHFTRTFSIGEYSSRYYAGRRQTDHHTLAQCVVRRCTELWHAMRWHTARSLRTARSGYASPRPTKY